MEKLILKRNGRKFIAVLLVLIIVLSSVSCKQEEVNKDEPKSKIEKEENGDKSKILKLDEGKEIIYDASYLDELEPFMAIDFVYDDEGEVTEKEVEVNFDDCKIPYINLDSNGAKKINEKILKYTRDIIFGDYEQGKEEAIAYEPMAYYSYELTDDYLSIKFEYNIGLFEVPDDVKAFVLDLESGEELSLDKAIEIAGIDGDFLGLIEGKIVEFYDDMLRDLEEFIEDASFFDLQAFTLYNFWQDYYGENLNFYLNSDREMSLLLNLGVPAGGGIIQEELKIKAEDLPMAEEINPVYEYLAKEDHSLYEGGVAFLGYNSLDTMETIASKVETIIYDVGYQAKLPLSYFYHELYDGSYGISGDEFYLLTAKYNNSVIKIYPSIDDGNVEMKFDDDAAIIYGSNCISFCNFSDIRPDTKVEFIYRDKTIEFTPSLSLMDSSYINEIDGIVDLGDAYREIEGSEINLEFTSTQPYMWRIFKMADFID